MGKQEKENDDAAGEAKSLTGSFVESLGLLEIIIGAGAIYWASLWYGDSLTKLFPSTGFDFVNIALMAFGASLFGKVFTFIATFMMAIVRYFLLRHTKYYKKLKAHWSDFSDEEKRSIDFIDFSLTATLIQMPLERKEFEKIRCRAILAYSISILAFPYWRYFVREDAPSLLTWATGLGILFFIAVGLMEQIDIIKTLSEKIHFVKK